MAHSKKKKKLDTEDNFKKQMENHHRYFRNTIHLAGPIRIGQLGQSIKEFDKRNNK